MCKICKISTAIIMDPKISEANEPVGYEEHSINDESSENLDLWKNDNWHILPLLISCILFYTFIFILICNIYVNFLIIKYKLVMKILCVSINRKKFSW